MPNTVRFHRVLRAATERVYEEFIDPGAMASRSPRMVSLARFTRWTPASAVDSAEAHDAFQEWRRGNAEAPFLNEKAENDLVLHKARCWHHGA